MNTTPEEAPTKLSTDIWQCVEKARAQNPKAPLHEHHPVAQLIAYLNAAAFLAESIEPQALKRRNPIVWVKPPKEEEP